MSTFDISSITKGIESWTHLMSNGFAGKLHGADLGTFEFSLVAMILCLIIVICGLLGIIEVDRQIARQKVLRESVMGSQMIPASTFLSNWKTTRSGNKVTTRCTLPSSWTMHRITRKRPRERIGSKTNCSDATRCCLQGPTRSLMRLEWISMLTVVQRLPTNVEIIMRSSSINGSHSSDYAHLKQAPGARSVHRRQSRNGRRR